MTAHPANRLFHALKSLEPEFTRKLSFDEQNALHAADPEKYWRYTDWLFAQSLPAARRWAKRERGGPNLDAQIDRNEAHREGWGWSEDYKQGSS